MDGDLISRKALLEKAERIYTETDNVLMTVSVVTRSDIVMAPAVDAEPVRHSKWVCRTPGMFSCNVCRNLAVENQSMNYCPECGAKMDGGAE